MTAWTLLILLTAHFVGDFVCQTDWMATNKSKLWRALWHHATVYSVVMTVAAVFLLPDINLWGHFYLATLVTHGLTDAVTSRWTSKLWFFRQRLGIWDERDPIRGLSLAEGRGVLVNPWEYRGGNRHWFFVAIGFDQLIHAWTLGLTWMWLSRLP